MEQSSGKIERLLLAAGLAVSLALAAAQYFCPVSRALGAGRDVRLALLNERAAVLLVYHPASSTVNAFTFSYSRPRKVVSGWQRAAELNAAAGASQGPARDGVFYVSLSTAPEMAALWATLNNWRNEPKLFFSAAGALYGLGRAGATNIGAFDLFSVFSEASRLGSSDFILTEMTRQTFELSAPEDALPGPAVRVEVFNASGKQGLAAQAARFLRARGFDVITEGTTAREKHSSILNFSKETAAALKLRGVLGLGELEIRAENPRRSVAVAAVVLGEDFDPASLAE